ncbi:MAG: hypothetical protein ACHQ6U_04190 [Thermodesulfobacteriota bacterium]
MANYHGLIASFVPKLFEDSSGSGCHFYISLWSKDKNVLGDKKVPWNLLKDGAHFSRSYSITCPALWP